MFPGDFLNQKCAYANALTSYIICVCTHVLIYLLVSKFILEVEDCQELEESRVGSANYST